MSFQMLDKQSIMTKKPGNSPNVRPILSMDSLNTAVKLEWSKFPSFKVDLLLVNVSRFDLKRAVRVAKKVSSTLGQHSTAIQEA